MALKTQPLEVLDKFLPKGTYDYIMYFLVKHAIHLSVKKDRRTLYGDYQPRMRNSPHKISINGGLNRYHFLITLLHEIAHLVVFEKYRERVQPHGKEWKMAFAEILEPVIDARIFPQDVHLALENYARNPKASSCSDPHLIKILKKYDRNSSSSFIADLPVGACFTDSKGRKMKILKKIRTRYECKELKTGAIYLFPQLYEVENYEY